MSKGMCMQKGCYAEVHSITAYPLFQDDSVSQSYCKHHRYNIIKKK